MTVLERTDHDDVVVLRWNDGENRYRGESVAAWHAALDDLAAIDGPLALVVTGTGKFFSNGLDLDWMSEHSEEAGPLVGEVHRLFGRLITFPAYTVGAINGHAFAGGAMLTCGFDERIMRSDRGYWCLPEVDLGLPLTDPMYAVVAARLPPATLHESIVTGRRYTGVESAAAGIVEAIATEDHLLGRAIESAALMAGKNRKVIARHKQQMYGHVADICGV